MNKKFYLLAVMIYLVVPISKSFASEGSTYYNFSWLDPDKEVYVLQNRKYRKKSRVYLTFGGGITTSGAFVTAQNGQGRLGYFFSESFGVELLYSANFGSTNSTFDAVKALRVVPLYRRTKNYFGGMLLWSPFYSKINTFNIVMYYDWVFGLGAARTQEENNRLEFLNNGGNHNKQVEDHTGVMWNTHIRWYLSKLVALRMDLTAIHYKVQKAGFRTLETKKTWNDNFDLTASLQFSF
ncbi:MAG: outer membrane beta-barrel domain-containing protein [Bacteriovoracaceae bacterium]|jgi:outer membrane beta-barrel protein|nr:outer membrane beta-barrel domain-containing protein [Bacteriovoracaceae bacterium]